MGTHDRPRETDRTGTLTSAATLPTLSEEDPMESLSPEDFVESDTPRGNPESVICKAHVISSMCHKCGRPCLDEEPSV